jgi:uncharacterized protein YhbP (UPF0306 family)
MAQQVAPDALDFMASQQTLTLATSGSDGPWAAPLTYVNDGPKIYVWMKPSTATAGHLQENPVAAFSVGQYTGEWKETKGIQGRGSAAVVQGEELANVAGLFGDKYPDLRPGATSAVVFYSIDADSLEFIDNTQGVDESQEFGADFRRNSAFDLSAIDDAG